MKTPEDYILQYGEKYRRLIEDSLKFLDEREPVWGVKMDRDSFIEELLSRVTVPEETIK